MQDADGTWVVARCSEERPFVCKKGTKREKLYQVKSTLFVVHSYEHALTTSWKQCVFRCCASIGISSRSVSTVEKVIL